MTRKFKLKPEEHVHRLKNLDSILLLLIWKTEFAYSNIISIEVIFE